MEQVPRQSNPAATTIWRALRRPRVVLALLAGWTLVAVATEFFTSSGLFMDLRGTEIDGALAGRALSWQGVPMAVLYLHSTTNPSSYQRTFWIGLAEQGAVIASCMYHLGAGDVSGESIVLPVAISAGLGVLTFLHIYEPHGRQPIPSAGSAG